MADNLLSSFLPDDRAATGFFPQMKPRRRFQDREASANVPLDITRGRVAGLAGLLPDVLNFMGRSPMPTEQFGETQYEPAQQLPYGSEYFLQTLPLKPTSKIGEVAGQAGAFVPLNPMPAARAVAAGARALGPTAVRMGEGYLQRQGLMPKLDVYHGSPHKFDRFDASKIGTGEGAQAYGHGIYTAENLGVAESYRQKLANAGNPLTKDKFGKFMEIVQKEFGGYYPTIKGIEYPTSAEIVDGIRVGLIKKGDVSDELFNYANQFLDEGSLYKVDLPDEQIAKMLDWDKPLSEQSVEIRSILAPIIEATAKSFPEIRKADPTGAQLYRSYVNHRGNNADYASEGFRQAGIPGIKYLDEGSRQPGVASMTQAQLDTRIDILKKDIDSGLGDQNRMKQILSSLEAERASHPKLTRNFVTFPGEEQNLTILERNNQPVQQNSLNSFIQ